MRQPHLGGEKLFVDHAGGDTVPVIIDRLSGEVRSANLRRVIGASNFMYAEATWSRELIDRIGAHTRAFAAIGGVPHLIVPDNAKAAVIKACHEPRSIARHRSHRGDSPRESGSPPISGE